MSNPAEQMTTEARSVLTNPAVKREVETILVEPDEITSQILVVALEAGVAARLIAGGSTFDDATIAARYVAERVSRERRMRQGHYGRT